MSALWCPQCDRPVLLASVGRQRLIRRLVRRSGGSWFISHRGSSPGALPIARPVEPGQGSYEIHACKVDLIERTAV